MIDASPESEPSSEVAVDDDLEPDLTDADAPDALDADEDDDGEDDEDDDDGEDDEDDATPVDRFAAIRRALEDEQEQLEAQVVELDPVVNEDLSFDENLSDRGQVTAELSENRTLAARLREQLSDVELALARLDDGTYGLCVACGDPIADQRLEAVPAARRCMSCVG